MKVTLYFYIYDTFKSYSKLILSWQKESLDVFCEKVVLKNFANFTGKAFTPAPLLKRGFSTVFRNTYFEEHLQKTASVLKS